MNQIPPEEDDEVGFDLIKWYTEYQGRRQRLLPPQFAENEIVTGPYPLDVNIWGAGYVPSFPNLDAIVVSAAGNRIPSEGGYIRLSPGKYKIYYVDRHEQYKVLPDIKAVTLDGADVTFSCGITFTVNDSLAVQNIRNPMDALFKACEAALRHVIRTHKHDEIIDERPDNDEPAAAKPIKIITDDQISDAVKLQVNLSEACRAFNLHNVNIIERRGHLRLLGVREEEAVRLRAGRKEMKQTDQRTELSKRQKLLTIEQGTVIEQQAKNETKRREILFDAEQVAIELQKLTLELELMRQKPKFSHEENLKIIDARIEALKMLMQAQAMGGASRSIDDVRQLVEKLTTDMPNVADDAPDKPTTSSAKDSNNDEFIELLIPKKKKK
ncbi:MAG: hypothetical protein Fur0016_29820 [Anaerolineales bacterium]